ncbi:hypothetical protein DIPPA_23588 [Diplonema papillatum]|nr:hypothetical protein DIPPA_23588 [Diplonema papillatum]
MQYVRVKRDVKTWFIHFLPTATIGSIKAEVARIENLAPENMRLMTTKMEPLEDSMVVVPDKVANNAEVYLVYKNADGSWEEACVKKPVYTTDEGAAAAAPTLPVSVVDYLDEMNPAADSSLAAT